MPDRPVLDGPRPPPFGGDKGPREVPPPAGSPPEGEVRPGWMRLLIYLAIALPLVALYLFSRTDLGGRVIPYTEFKSLVAQDKVAEVELRGRAVQGRLTSPEATGGKLAPDAAFTTNVPEFGDEALLPLLEKHGVAVQVGEAAGSGWLGLLLASLPWLLFLLFIVWSVRKMSAGMSNPLGERSELKKFLAPSARMQRVPDVTFADVAGQDNAKREVAELVEYLREPERFRKLGAEVPRGVLLMGPPGTGKTMLAKALAGEAGVPFFTISGSDFIEVFVGVGASRVRNLFQEAKKEAPCILFIDELDSVGRTRGTGLGGGHDEREQTLNQILAEMDGFHPHETVIVLGATNRSDVLDPALLRPGRFDRHVTLDLPDRRDREAILKVHVRKVPLAEGVELDKIAATTPGFSGADLKNLVNEAAILAARENAERVTMRHFDDARDRVILGSTRALLVQGDERRRLAVHEAGHATVAYFLPKADPLYKVSIIPRGRALGGTQQLPEQDRYTLAEDYLQDRLAVMLGGRSAERELMGNVSSGADDDIRKATALARAMVGRWGMSEKIGPVDLGDTEEAPFLGREIAQPRRHSDVSAHAVDVAVRELLVAAEAKALAVLREHRAQLEALIGALEAKESLDKREIEASLGVRPGVA